MKNDLSSLRRAMPALIILFFSVQSFAQPKQYTYYMNDQMQIVPKQEATIVGKGSQRDSIFLMQFYTVADSRLFLIEMFKDSTLSVSHGNRILYHQNRKKAESSFYQNSMLHGTSLSWDTAGRITDSIIYFEDMPHYLAKYSYNLAGNRQIIHEFANYSEKTPTDNAVIITPDGTTISAEVWKNLMYSGRYAFKKDNVAANTYLLTRVSDNLFNKMVANDPKPKESGIFKNGQNFEINETDINGNKLRSKELKGTILVINYWFINCKPCRLEMPELNELVKEYKNNPRVKFIAIALDDKAAIKDFLKLMPFNYQIVADGRYATEKYGVRAFPTHVIVDGAGKVYFHTVSSPRQLFYWMRKSINELLKK